MNGNGKKEITEEALKYAELKKKSPLISRDITKVFILNKEWYNKWKEYVNYKSVIESKSQIQNSKDGNKLRNANLNKKEKPGKINNQIVLYDLSEFYNDGDPSNPENIVVRHNIDEKKSLKIVNEDIWKMFKKLYNGGPEISKTVYEEKINNLNNGNKYIQIHQLVFNVCFLPKYFDLDENLIQKLKHKNTFISKNTSLSDLKIQLTKIVNYLKVYEKNNVTSDNLRLWKLNSNYSIADLQKLLFKIYKNNKSRIESELVTYLEYVDSKLGNLPLADTDIILVEYFDNKSEPLFEKKNIEFRQGSCPGCETKIEKQLIMHCACKEAWYCSNECKNSCYSDHLEKCPKHCLEDEFQKKSKNSRMAIVGLQNLSNTCFMNTSLQCISNCWELTNYFLQNHYLKDINVKNPIGTKGILAREFANLLKQMWHGDKSVISPWNLKNAIAKFQPMFAGNGQHDAQEFLNFLLDGLHEDLNRVLNKPLVEKDESKNQDDIKSLSQWYGFLLRNQSIMVDLLYGQFKSILYCPDDKCQNISTTFEPFLTISLPLTNRVEQFEVLCFFIFYDITISPIQLSLPYNYECSIMAFRNKISSIIKIHPFSFFIIKMNAEASYDHIVSSSGLLNTNNHFYNTNQKPFFLLQIDPELFYNESENKFFAKDLMNYKTQEFSKIYEDLELNVEKNKKYFKDDYEEDESGATNETSFSYYSKIPRKISDKNAEMESLKINTDDNHGFSRDYIRVILYLFTYSTKDKKPPSVKNRERIIFPRMMYFKLNSTTESIHKTIFKYFQKLFQTKNEDLWINQFDTIDTSDSNDTYEFHKKIKYPYRLRIKNIYKKINKKCVLCEKADCHDCLLPCTSKIKLKHLLNKYPKNIDGAEIDNTYFYLSESQRNLHKSLNRDFELELTWLPEYREEVYKLNDKLDHDFKLEKAQLSKIISIYDCFKKFVKFEKLEETNEWYCMQCKTHKQATKKMEIYQLPHILIIHLKRFKDFNKIESLVDYPIIDLDLSGVVISNNQRLSLKYDLFAVANHVGNTSTGHYFAYAKNPQTGLWNKFDDSNVTPVSQNEIVSGNAYVLFYRRKNLENIIDLEGTYKNRFFNYTPLMENVEATVKALNELSIIDFS